MDYDDSGYTSVTIPHCVTPLSFWNWNPQSWENIYIYRRHFDVPQRMRGKRLFVEFQGVMVDATTTINGHTFPVHQGGYLPFAWELTPYIQDRGNVLAVEVNSNWLYVPPEGNPGGPQSVDYLQPGGIYRDVRLYAVPQTFISDVFACPENVLESIRSVVVHCTIDSTEAVAGSVVVSSEVRSVQGNTLVGRAYTTAQLSTAGSTTVRFVIQPLRDFKLWSVDRPNLYYVNTTLHIGGRAVHTNQVRIGFRQANFEVDGFFLNGKRFKLFGLDRHQIFPFTGMAMPARSQRHDAEMLKYELNCNMVRCSHYPQSPQFLDACDEIGLMVWEETPGWGYVGDATWQAICVQNVHDMVVRDRNRPSVIIWGTRVNEAPNVVPLWATTRQLCYELDGSRPSSGTMTSQSLNNWAEDVFAFDDYSHTATTAYLQPPIPTVPYLVTESVGAIDPPHYYLHTVSQYDQQQQAILHGEVHSLGAQNNGYSGVLSWCAIDYDSLNGAIMYHMKWPGVTDTFRIAKPGASMYMSQVDPSTRVVIEPSFFWDFSPTSPVTSLAETALVWTNCDRIEAYLDQKPFATLRPTFLFFSGLAYPPMYLDLQSVDGSTLPELQLDGYVNGRLVLQRKFSSDTNKDALHVAADHAAIVADGSDATRVVFRAVDRYGNLRPYTGGVVQIRLSGPAILVGETEFSFQDYGGCGAVWVKSRQGQTGTAELTVTHPVLGTASARVRIVPATAEMVQV